MNSNDEYIKIDPNTDVTWENLGEILCEHIAQMNVKRAAINKEPRNKAGFLENLKQLRY